MAGMDIFGNDAFQMMQLTAAVNHGNFAPSRIRNMGIFSAQGVATTKVAIEEQHGTLTLIPTSERGSAPSESANKKRKLRNFEVPHLSRAARLKADEIQGVRAFGSLSEVESMEGLVTQRTNQKLMEMDLTEERMMLAALRGILIDADDSVIYDYFSEFAVSAETDVEFAFDTITQATADDGIIRNTCAAVKRLMIKNLRGMPTGSMSITALCGHDFFDALTSNAETAVPFKNWSAAAAIKDFNPAFETFRYAQITFEDYEGDDAGEVSIASDECQFVARGVPGLFDIYYAPADTFEFVNTMGLPRYSLPHRDPRDKWWESEIQSNPLPICTRPKSLVKGVVVVTP